MKLLDTSSNQCKILISDGKKYIVKYPRKLGANTEYYRSTPECKIIEILQQHKIRSPKVLYQCDKYSIQEFVQGKLLADVYQDHKNIDKSVIDQIARQICLLSTINEENLLRYTSWNNNSDFYQFQCSNTEKVFKDYHMNLKQLYNALSISPTIFDLLYSQASKISNDRKVSLMHGDMHKKNAIISDNGNLTFIDWELGCIVDITYDIAFHLHQMAYTEADEQYFMNKLKENYKGDFESLKKDIDIYRLFILARSTLYHVYWTDLLYQDKDKNARNNQLGHFMRRYNKLCRYIDFGSSPKSESDLHSIFKSYRKNIVQEER